MQGHPFWTSPAPRLLTRVVEEFIAWLRLQAIRAHTHIGLGGADEELPSGGHSHFEDG